MDNNQNIPSWELPSSEPSPEAEARAAEWKDSMKDAPEFAGDQPTPPARDERIAKASGVISALNGPFCELVEDGNIKNIDNFIDTIYYFVPQGDQPPFAQITNQLGIDTAQEFKELEDEKRARKVGEDAYRQNVNAPLQIQKSREAAMESIRQFKLLIDEVNKSDAFTEVRNGALANGVGPFAYMLKNSQVRDLPTLFSTIAKEKQKYENKKAEQPVKVAISEEADGNSEEEKLEELTGESTPKQTSL